MKQVLGCIADDLTGATDLANNLARGGMQTQLLIGVPGSSISGANSDAIVVALKSRTASRDLAVSQSVAAARWLRRHGASQIYFKICSTFDSTPGGNIGPVTEALMEELDADFVVINPAFPTNGRTVYQGHLFVGDRLLSESSMRDHPLTPMTDADLVRVMQAQLDPSRSRRVGRIDYSCVSKGHASIEQCIETLRSEGVSMAVVDALSDIDLLTLAQVSAKLKLVVASSGLAIGIPATYSLTSKSQADSLPSPIGACAVVSGSCSSTTNAQVAAFLAQGGKAFAIDPLKLTADSSVVEEAVAWARAHFDDGPVLVYATAEPAAVQSVQRALGADRASVLVESALSQVALGLVEAGVGQLIVAGGETSGACVQALGVTTLSIGPQIDPGVPWCHAAVPTLPSGLHIALKSGNFGRVDFFSRAFTVL